jgi:hypothetical protein
MFTKCIQIIRCFLVTLIVLLTACAPQVVSTPNSTSPATSKELPTAIATTGAPINITPTPILPMNVDDAHMARLRLANFVQGFPEGDGTDMYVDGQIPLLGSRQLPLARVPNDFISGFLYVTPGVHHVAIVPAGKDLSSAMIALDVTLEPGHRYTVAAMGNKEDPSFIPLVIDETAALAKARTSPDQNIMILVNNVAGAKTFDFLEDGVGPKGVPYGGYVAAPIKTGYVDHLVALANATADLNDNPGNFDELPGIDFIHANRGSFPGAIDQTIFVVDSSYMSDLNVIELLGQISAANVAWDPGHKLSFQTFLSALEKTDLPKILSSGTYMILAPTDEAFQSMSAELLNSLMGDPKTLENYLRNYIVQGYYPYGGISGKVLGQTDATLTSLAGTEVKIEGDTTINGVSMPFSPSITILNGTRIMPVTKLFVMPQQ